ncbi:hypothetical protein PENTCL1PPCAC_15822, partial [Pristionchus entomophagus]
LKMLLVIIRTIHDASCSVSLLLNSFLIFVIVAKTPEKMRTYSVVLFNFALLESITAIATMNCEEYALNAVTGPCRFTESRTLCFPVYACMMHGHSHYSVLLAFSFSYRFVQFSMILKYYVIKYPTLSKCRLVAALLFIYAPTAIVYILYACAPHLDVAGLQSAMADIYPEYDFESRAKEEMIIGAPRNLPTHVALLWIERLTIPAYVVIIVVSINVNKLLGSSLKMSEQSRK